MAIIELQLVALFEMNYCLILEKVYHKRFL